ncbi:MAG: HAD-IIB family hydrolase [bacterium]|nr:HAD-IIB family hydrolase [bacterium]
MNLLATDLDGTLIGDHDALQDFVECMAPARDRILIAYVTGRSLRSVLSVIENTAAPVPDFILPGLGSDIYRAPSWDSDWTWHDHLSRDWDRERVVSIARQYGSLVPQPLENQAIHKVSFHVRPPGCGRVVEDIRDRFMLESVPAKVVYSSGRDVDLIPLRGGKGEAVRHLVRHLGLTMDRVLTVGDSGNDEDMLRLGCHAAVVANAQAELHGNIPGHVYRARSSHAAGILEALHHVGWLGEP